MPFDYKSDERKIYAKQYYEKNKVKAIRKNWIRQIERLGCTVEQYNELLVKQCGVCAICLQPNLKGRQLAVDHCHKTGKIRGLLCNPCNLKLTALEDPNWKAFAEVYLALG